MLKNKLYPYIEKYINEYLYGFTKEQLEVGIMNGTIKLEYLNLRPDKVNSKLDEKNLPIWLKAGLISKISVGCSLMNFIGEKPLDVLIDGVDVIVTPSYKWIIRNLESFIEENDIHIKDIYDPNDNNSIDIFTKKVNIFDNSIFKQQVLIEIFKDKTQISQMINKVFKMCFKFYYMKNYLVNLKIKNVHIRFEDDQLINYLGDIALGFKVSSIELSLSAEGIMKRNSFKIEKMDVYWESKPVILISSDLLNKSTDKDNKLDDKYYSNLKKLNFGKFSYVEGTKFLVENFNFMGNFGTQALNSGNIDLFGKRENNYKLYVQFASSELNLQLFPDLLPIATNFQKFVREFSVIEQVQDFKPMKKPYNKKNPIVADMLRFCQNPKNKNEKLAAHFLYKKKMLVRDWLYYFYWCKKCNSSIYGKTINPLRLEFSRFFNLCFTDWENDMKLNDSIELKKEKDKEGGKKDNVSSSIADSNFGGLKSQPTNENPNPDNVNIAFSGEFLIKGVNINLHPRIKSSSSEYVAIKLNSVEIKTNINKEVCDVNVNVKTFGFGPNELIKGERVIIATKRKQASFGSASKNQDFSKQRLRISTNQEDSEKNSVSSLLLKNNPTFAQRMKILNETFTSSTISTNTQKAATDFRSGTGVLKSKAEPPRKTKKDSDLSILSMNSSLLARILEGKSETPQEQKKIIEKQQNNYSISKAISDYNKNKIRNRGSFSSQNPIIPKAKNSLLQLSSDKQIIPLNLLELYTSQSQQAISLKFTKSNNDTTPDAVRVNLGVIRLNPFAEYASICLSIISEYRSLMNKPQIKPVNNEMAQGLKVQKQLLFMKKHIYQYLLGLPEVKITPQIKEYMAYLKKETDSANNIMNDKSNFEINYLFSMFSRGIEIEFDYENFECVYYQKEKGVNVNRILGKALIPSVNFAFKLTLSRIFVRAFDLEFEINDLENSKILMTTLLKILEEKLKTKQILIEPCLKQLKAEMEKINHDKEKELEFGSQPKQTKKPSSKGLVKNEEKDFRGITRTLQDNEENDSVKDKGGLNAVKGEIKTEDDVSDSDEGLGMKMKLN